METARPSSGASRFARVASVAALLTSSLVLIGWLTGNGALTSLVPGWPRMVALTALLFALASVSLWLTVSKHTATGVPFACAAVVLIVGSLRLAAYPLAWNVHPLETLNLDFASGADPVSQDSMAPATALGFALLGAALILGQRVKSTRLFQTLTLGVLLIGWLGFARYVFGGPPLVPVSAMALHTALLFLLSSAGTLAMRADASLTSLLLGAGAGGESARHLLPAAVLIPLGAGALALYSERGGWLATEPGISLFALSSVLVFAGLVWAHAAHLEKTDQQRRLAETALRDSQQLLQSIVDNSQAVIYMKDLEGRYLLINRRYEEIFNVDRTAVLGRTDYDLFSKEAADAFRDMDRRAARMNRALTEEEDVPQADGPHVYISVKAPLRSADGEIRGVFGVSTDITDQKRAEERLRKQVARLNLLDETTRAIAERQDLRSIFQVVIRSLEDHLPVDFGCVCLHESAQRTLSVTCVGMKSHALALELGLTEHAQVAIDEHGLGQCIRGKLVYEPNIFGSRSELAVRLARGGLRSLVLAPFVVANKVFGVMIVARRAPEAFTGAECEFLRQLSGHVALAGHQAQLYSALQSAYEDLRLTQQSVIQQERLRALGQMASGIAHDINNALSPAALYIQMLIEREHSSREETRDRLLIVQRAIDDVASTVARMREFSRPQEPQPAFARVDLNLVLEQVIELTRVRWIDMAQERGILIRVQRDLQKGLPEVLGTESEIRDALTNLVLNAIDAMPEGGTLTLRTRASPTANQVVTVEVSDSGTGMTEAVRSRCLEPFFTTKGERGTGLGLAMVYGMTQRHGAELEIDSEPGAGTTMRLIFPVATQAMTSTADAIRESLGQLELLLVDDDPLLLKSLRDALERDGHRVASADGGQAGIDEFSSAQRAGRPFDVVVTDLGMPEVDGRTVAAAIKSMAPDTPVILLTGWGYRLRAEGEVPQHVDRVLSKPPKLHELRATLTELVSTQPSHPREAILSLGDRPVG